MEANSAALSSKRACAVTHPDIDRPLWMWVKDRMPKSRMAVSGSVLRSLTEIMDAAMKLENETPTVGGRGSEPSKLCCRFRAVMNLEAQQTTLIEYFTHDES